MTIPCVLAAIMTASLVLYVLLAGADYGAGFWDLLSSGPLGEEQKELIADAIQPIWEANHVWLILILVLLFACFPPAFGAVMVALHVPILLMLAGIVLRGSSFVFRAYSTSDSPIQRAYAYIFSISSSFTPLFFGIVLASISDDHVVVSQDVSVNGYLLDWLNPFSLSMGLLTVALFAFLAAVYLTVEAQSEDLQRTFRIRALAVGVAECLLVATTYFLSTRYAAGLREGLKHNDVARFFELVAGIALALALIAVYKSHYRAARTIAAVHAGSVVVAWAAGQYPYLVRPQWTIFNSVLSETVTRDIALACAAGSVLLFPSLGALLYVFKDQRRSRAGSPSTEARP